MSIQPFVRVLFDEFHSASWTISFDRAREINPENPHNSSYSRVANLLTRAEFQLKRNVDCRLTKDNLAAADVLILLHPCNPKWEATTSLNPPRLDKDEIQDIVKFVKEGGALLVISEYENDKYGNNLNELLLHFGLEIQNKTLSDKSNSFKENQTWVILRHEGRQPVHPLLQDIDKICYFRGGTCQIHPSRNPAAFTLITSSASARPADVPVTVGCEFSKGRVVVFADSDLFGDKFSHLFDHSKLWINACYWLAAARFDVVSRQTVGQADERASLFDKLSLSINSLRKLQTPNGAKFPEIEDEQLKKHIAIVQNVISDLVASFPHQKDYFLALLSDFEQWEKDGFGVPDFSRSLASLYIERKHENSYIIMAPMYLMNASSDVKFDSILTEILWPSWLADLGRVRWPNHAFISAILKKFSEGYKSECAVFFPEMVSGNQGVETKFGIIFSNREAERFQRICKAAAKITNLQADPQLGCFLNNLYLIENAFALWDLIHDTTHNKGPLPRVLFKEKRRQPYWMYAMEELRVDLGSWLGAHDLYLNSNQVMGLYASWSVLFDRIFRFPITGNRIKNYDGLAGQILTNALFKGNALIWEGGILCFHWEAVGPVLEKLYTQISDIESKALTSPHKHDWRLAYELVCEYVPPAEISTFRSASIAECVYDKDRGNFKTVLDDEFPLSKFHLWLQKQLKGIIA